MEKSEDQSQLCHPGAELKEVDNMPGIDREVVSFIIITLQVLMLVIVLGWCVILRICLLRTVAICRMLCWDGPNNMHAYPTNLALHT